MKIVLTASLQTDCNTPSQLVSGGISERLFGVAAARAMKVFEAVLGEAAFPSPVAALAATPPDSDDPTTRPLEETVPTPGNKNVTKSIN